MKFHTSTDLVQGDLVLVDYSVYKEANKQRPCVIISNHRYTNSNTKSGYFIVAPLYTVHDESKVARYQTHIPVRKSDTVDKQGKPRGTNKEYSYMAIEQAVSVPAENIICKLGRMQGYKMGYGAQVRAVLRRMF